MLMRMLAGWAVGCSLAGFSLIGVDDMGGVAHAMASTLDARTIRGARYLGRVHLANSCNAEIQGELNDGVAALYSFWFPVARKSFKKAERRDPNCMIAYWGDAMSDYEQIEGAGLPEGDQLRAGLATIARGRTARETTPREKAYLAAIAIIFDKAGTPDHDQRVQKYSAAMGDIYARYPWDQQAAVIYAMSLLKDGMPNDPDLRLARKSLAILNTVRAREPNNPGVVHFIIHATDNPSMAAYGLTAAREYAKIAPAAPHALHMPGHIFARLGLWKEDIEANLASAAAARPLVHGQGQDLVHALEFLQYAYLQTGRAYEAESAAREAASIRRDDYSPGVQRYYGFMEAGFRVRQAIETHSWAEALSLRAPAGADPQVRRVYYWAHAVAAGHIGDRVEAQQALARYRATYAPAQLASSQAQPSALYAETEAWASSAGGNLKSAAALLRPIADRQDKLGKGEVELPAREMLGNMLEMAGDYQGAALEYRASLLADPGRLNTLLRAGIVSQKLGRVQQACSYSACLSLMRRTPLDVCDSSWLLQKPIIGTVAELKGRSRLTHLNDDEVSDE